MKTYADVKWISIIKFVTTSAFIDEHMEHYEEDHLDVDIAIKCKLENCDFKANIPEDMIMHIRYHHIKHQSLSKSLSFS